jgi:hypothetical protein
MATFVRLPDGTTWPHPNDPDGIEWQLRYGSPESVRMTAAAYVAAYKELVWQSTARRAEVLREMKRLVRSAAERQET